MSTSSLSSLLPTFGNHRHQHREPWDFQRNWMLSMQLQATTPVHSSTRDTEPYSPNERKQRETEEEMDKPLFFSLSRLISLDASSLPAPSFPPYHWLSFPCFFSGTSRIQFPNKFKMPIDKTEKKFRLDKRKTPARLLCL